ncbi:hypothetical protein ACNS7O_12525 [Haloferacaceae archaeon DSL9]
MDKPRTPDGPADDADGPASADEPAADGSAASILDRIGSAGLYVMYGSFALTPLALGAMALGVEPYGTASLLLVLVGAHVGMACGVIAGIREFSLFEFETDPGDPPGSER